MTEAELTRMKELVAESMEGGAFGLSTGLIYAPGNYAEIDEIAELAKVASDYSGLYATHIRSERNAQLSAIAEAVKIGEEADLPVHIAHHKIAEVIAVE